MVNNRIFMTYCSFSLFNANTNAIEIKHSETHPFQFSVLVTKRDDGVIPAEIIATLSKNLLTIFMIFCLLFRPQTYGVISLITSMFVTNGEILICSYISNPVHHLSDVKCLICIHVGSLLSILYAFIVFVSTKHIFLVRPTLIHASFSALLLSYLCSNTSHPSLSILIQ